MDNNNINNSQQNSNDVNQLKDLITKCLANWYWFVLTVALCVGAAFLYLRRSVPVYERTAKVLIKSESKGASAGDYDFSNLGLVSSHAKVTNEVSAFSAVSNMMAVVRRLGLETSCYVDGPGHRVLMYAQTLPVKVAIDSLGDMQSASFTVVSDSSKRFVLKDFVLSGQKLGNVTAAGELNDTIHTPVGPVRITPNGSFNGNIPGTFHVVRNNLYSTTNSFSRRLSVTNNYMKERSDVISLTIQDINIQRAEDVLNTLIAVYNENWIKDKNQVANSTSMFINERLSVIERELASVDSDISSYKSEQLLPNVEAVANMYMNRNSAIDAQLQQLNNQLSMARYIRKYVVADNDPGKLLPVNSGIESGGIESQIKEYNAKVLQRNSLLANSSTSNPLVIQADNAIVEMRRTIVGSVDNLITSLESQIANLQQIERKNTSRIAANPTQAKHLLGVERQQAVKEALYLFLLQKREENELGQAFTAYNTRIIDPPTGSMSPISPSRSKILLVAFLLGLLIPVGVLFLMNALNTTVRSRDDLKGMSVPFLGEIPVSDKERKYLSRRQFIRFLRKKTDSEGNAIVVEKGNRNAINEAFRILRTNVEFMTQTEPHCVIGLTSFNPGSGKSFVSLNLALALAIKNKKVLLIDGDFRHCSQSKNMGNVKVGFADYLAGRTDDLKGLIHSNSEYPTLFGLPVGTVPPNPTELIADQRFESAIASLKEDYDYVIIDCPPIEIVADAQIIERSCNRTFFIVRAGLFERTMLGDLEGLYQQGKFKSLSMILNGTSASSGRYYYRYGYHSYYHSYYNDADGKKTAASKN